MSGGEDPALAARLTLQAWLSPGYPVGGYSFSAGLEAAAAENAAADGRDLSEFLEVYLEDGPGWSDALFLVEAHRAAAAADWPRLAAAAELAAAFGAARERRLETRAQGAAFLQVTLAAYPPAEAEADVAALVGALGDAPAYPIAFGALAAAHGAPLAEATALFLQSVAANLISAGVRLALLGQTEGQRRLAALAPRVQRLSVAALAADLEDLGGAMVRGDLWSMRHETQEVRLFRS